MKNKVLKTIAIRVDASTRIGIGHVMRCLTLAKKLQQQDVVIIFLCKQHKSNLNTFIKQQGFAVISLSAPKIDIEKQTDDKQWLGCSYQQDAQEVKQALKNMPWLDWLIVDHYSLDHRWQRLIKPITHQIMVIDDLANRQHFCNILLDQTLGRCEQSYQHLVPKYCRLLLGSDFMLLRDEFAQYREQAKIKRNQTIQITKVLISLGGTDPDNITAKIISWLIKNKREYTQLSLSVVLNPASEHLIQLNKLTAHHNWIKLIVNSSSMAKLMLKADVAIGTAGTSAWERCCLGLPTLTITSASNQSFVAQSLTKAGMIINLGNTTQLTAIHLLDELNKIISSPKSYHDIANSALALCDGLGSTIVSSILTYHNMPSLIQLRLATSDDCKIIFSWQSNSELRKYSRYPNAVKWNEHQQWYNNTLNNPQKTLFIILYCNMPCGILRLDSIDEKNKEISILLDSNYQGKNIAYQAIKSIPNKFKKMNILATVHSKNIASQRLFTRLGFEKTAKEQFILKSTLSNNRKHYE